MSNELAIAPATQSLTAWTPSFTQTISDMKAAVDAKRDFMRSVMREGEHYGTIPGGSPKKVLLKSGAEVLLNNMGLRAVLSDAEPPIRDYNGTGIGDGEPLIFYRRKCCVYRQTGPGEADRMLIAQAEGFCSSRESKYRWRNAQRACPQCGKPAIIKGKADYGGGWLCFKNKGGCGAKFDDTDQSIVGQQLGKIPNPDIADVENTILKMADKRALVATALIATGCSDIFTQDVEDEIDPRHAPPQDVEDAQFHETTPAPQGPSMKDLSEKLKAIAFVHGDLVRELLTEKFDKSVIPKGAKPADVLEVLKKAEAAVADAAAKPAPAAAEPDHDPDEIVYCADLNCGAQLSPAASAEPHTATCSTLTGASV